MSVTEGSTATYTVVLDTAPSANVAIAVANRGQSSDDSDLTVSPASLTFTSSNWNTTGTGTVSAAQDADTADGSAVITHTATSTDSNYGGITISNVTATEDDDDTPPTSADVTLAVSRDNRTAIPLSRFPFSDADGGTLRGVKIVTLPAPSAGTLGLVKTGIYAGAATTVLCVGTIDAIVAGQEVLNAVSSVLYFCPKDGFTHATFRFQVIDSQGRSSTRTQSTGQTNIATLVGPPGQVTGLAAEAGSGYVRLIWTDPQNPAITGYEYRQKSGANAYGAWTAMTGTGATTTRYSVSSLTNATAYTFQVRAKSKGGAGPVPSAAVTATPASGVPAKPTGFRGLLGLYNCTVSGTAYYCVHLFWDDPLDPTITRWEVERKHPSYPNNWIKGSIAWPDKKVPNSSASTTSVIVAAGGGHITTAYKFRVRAVNTAGAGPWSAEESVFVNPHDAAPVLLAPTAGNGRVALNWRYFGPQAACSSACWDVNQAPISNAGKDLRTHTVTGLTNGQTYTYKVRTSVVNADNSIVDGPESNQVSITLPAAPAKPTVKPASAGASLSWTDPDNDDITGWQYQQKLSSETWGSGHKWTRVPSSNAGTTSVSGLTNGTAYTFRVRAVIEYTTALGGPLAGAASDEASVTPVGVVVSKDRLALTEGAAVSIYTVALSHAPTADVTITVSVDSDGTVTADTNDNLTGNQTTLTFTTTNYNTAQTVKVTAAEDDDGRHSTATITHTVTSTDARYGNLTGIPGLTAAVTDNDSLGITLSGSSVSVTEGSTATYTVQLGAKPTSNVTVTIARNSGGDTDLAVDTDPASGNQNKKTLTFTTANYNTAQTVTVSAAQDDNDVIDSTATFTHTAAGGGYGNVTAVTLTATETDNDTGIVLTPASVSVPEGSTATYTVKLGTQPSASVTVAIDKASGGDMHLSVSPTTLTFTGGSNGNWASAQTVTVTAQDDSDALNGTATFTHTAAGAGSGYAGTTATLTATEADDERGITLTPASGVTVPEGGTNTYTVKLASQPTGTVTVAIDKASGGDTHLSVSPTTLTFTGGSNGNWDTTQTVTVTADEDDSDVINGTATFTHTATNGGYGGVSATLTATEADDEAGITLSTTSVSVPEGGTATYTVELAFQPSADVTVTITRNTGGDTDLTVDTDPASGDQNTLTFTNGNWDDAQTVTVSAAVDVDDDNGTATFTHTPSGGDYGGAAATLTATELDGARGITLSTTGVTVPEGGTATYTVVLDSQPNANVTVEITKTGDTNLTVTSPAPDNQNKTKLTFTGGSNGNWSTAQTVTVSAAEDNDDDNGTATFTHTASGGGYDDVETASLTATEADNERGIVLSQTSFSLPEGTTWDYKVRLASQPDSDVTVAIARNTRGDTDLTVNKSSLTFTTGNWNKDQTVTVTAKEDNDALNGTATFTHTASDGGYDDVTASLPVTEEDNERGLDLSASSLSVPEGAGAQYTVRLKSQPVGNVTVTITRLAEATTDEDLTLDTNPKTTGNQNTMTFTTSNWNSTQTVTVSAAADDSDAHNGTARFGHAATGGGYGGVSAQLTATEVDDEPGTTLSKTGVSVPEGGTATYTVKLAFRPVGNVTVTVAKNADGDTNLTANKSSLTFTVVNWNQDQTVTATADKDALNGTATFTHTASGGGYGGVSAMLTATESDNDRVVGIPAVLSVPEGETSTYDVKLAEQPSSTVTLTVTATQSSNAAVTVDTDANAEGNQNKMTFTPANYSTAQTVTVAAAQDDNTVNGSAVITTTASSSDAGYDGIPIPSVTVSEVDTASQLRGGNEGGGGGGSTPAVVGAALSKLNVPVPEGSTATYTVKLASQPAAAVTLTVANRGSDADDPDLTVDTDPATPGNQNTLTFTPATWDTLQTVTLAAAHDADGLDGTAVITHTLPGATRAARPITIAAVTATELDDDRAVTLSAPRVSVPEGGTTSYTVVLATQPTSVVTISVANRGGAADDADPTASPTALTFTPDDWNTPQTVTLSAAQDADGVDGVAVITHTATSGDAGYDAIAIANVTVTELDDDRAVTLSASNVSVPEGGTASYTVVLATPPTAAVTIAVANRGGPPPMTPTCGPVRQR